jgi:tRNA(fMet)-specific endonuclease VapC
VQTARIQEPALTDIVMCTIVAAELYYGVLRSNDPLVERVKVDLFLSPFQMIPFDLPASIIYAMSRQNLEACGNMIGHYDVMIAAISMANGLTLVTHNTKEFSRIAGLNLIDWELP